MYVGPGPNLSCLVGIRQIYVESVLQSCQFAECHRILYFHESQASLPITRAQDHKCARLKLEEEVCPDLEARQRGEEGEEHARLEAEEKSRLIEGTRLKSEEEEEQYARLEAEEQARLVEETRTKYEDEEQVDLKADKKVRLFEEARQKAEEHKHARLKVEHGVCLALEEDGQ